MQICRTRIPITTASKGFFLPTFNSQYSKLNTSKQRLLIGKKPVLECLINSSGNIKRIIVSKEDRTSENVPQILEQAKNNNIPVIFKSRASLSRRSSLAHHDQGVVAELEASNTLFYEDFLQTNPLKCRLVTFDNVTTPQNIGMSIRSIAAGGWLDGVLIPRVGICSIDHPLVAKAAAGTTTLPRLQLLSCHGLYESLQSFSKNGFELIGLDKKSKTNLFAFVRSPELPSKAVFVLGGESRGLSAEIRNLLNRTISIPIAKGIRLFFKMEHQCKGIPGPPIGFPTRLMFHFA